MLKKMVVMSLSALLFWACSSVAQVPDLPSNPNSTSRAIPDAQRLQRLEIYPQASWYSPATSGSGWYFSPISTGPGVDLLNMTGFIYDREGRQAFVLGNAPRPATNNAPEAMWANQPLGSIAVDLLKTSAGACPTCPYVRPVTSPSEFNRAEVTWLAPTLASVKVDGLEIPRILPADIALGPGWAGRIEGQHFGPNQARSIGAQVFPPPLITTDCRVEFRRVNKPFQSTELVFVQGTVLPVQPDPNATWFQLAVGCSTTQSPGPDFPIQPINEYVAAPSDRAAPFAPVYQLIPTQRVLDASGNVLSFEIRPDTRVGRIYMTGPQNHLYLRRQAQDSRIVEWELLLRRTR
jgi:hypothetical protein